jgi:Protein of unknown function (DUF2949)
MLEPHTQIQLIRFLREDLSLSSDSLDLALRHHPLALNFLPMLLWQLRNITWCFK